MPNTDQIIENKPAHAIIKVPANPTGDVWLNLLDAFVLRYAEPPVDADISVLERELNTRKSEVLRDYGLHLNV